MPYARTEVDRRAGAWPLPLYWPNGRHLFSITLRKY
jgi:hypothetical protein